MSKRDDIAAEEFEPRWVIYRSNVGMHVYVRFAPKSGGQTC